MSFLSFSQAARRQTNRPCFFVVMCACLSRRALGEARPPLPSRQTGAQLPVRHRLCGCLLHANEKSPMSLGHRALRESQDDSRVSQAQWMRGGHIRLFISEAT
jgi:hypothetical protein